MAIITLTQQDRMVQRERERDEEADYDIEVTPAMRRAGGRIIEDVFDTFDGTDLAEQIFREMMAIRKAESS
jgi:hypothetical protein